MVRKTRAQSARAAKDSASSSQMVQVSYVDTQLQEITAYFEARAASGGLIDITKDVGDKVNKVLNYCRDTQEDIKQSSIVPLVSCTRAESIRSGLSLEAFTCLLNIFLISESCQHKLHGLEILLDVARRCDYTLPAGSINASEILDQQQDIATATVIKSIKTRLQENLDSEEADEILKELLAVVSTTPAGLTTDSPLDVRVSGHADKHHTNAADIQSKRKRDEIPDSLEDTSILELPSDIHLEKMADTQLSSKSCTVESAQKEVANHLGDEPNPNNHQERPRKRPRRVTETGSPIPTQISSGNSPVLAKQHVLEERRQEQPSPVSEKEKVLIARDGPQHRYNEGDLPKANITTPIAWQNKDDSSVQSITQAGQMDVRKKGENFQKLGPVTGESSVLGSPRRFSALQSASEHTDQALFDEYLDLEHGMVIVSQPPENIFSSPQRAVPTQVIEEGYMPTPEPISTIIPVLAGHLTPMEESCMASKEWATLKPLPETEVGLELQSGRDPARSLHQDGSTVQLSLSNDPIVGAEYGCPKLVISAPERTAHFQKASVLSQQLEISNQMAENSMPKPLPDVRPNNASHRMASPELQTLPACQEIDQPAQAPTFKETRIKHVKTSLSSTRVNNEDEPTLATIAPVGSIPATVLSHRIQQLVSNEMEKAIRGLGTYLCSTSYQDLFLSHDQDNPKDRIRRTTPLQNANMGSVPEDSAAKLPSQDNNRYEYVLDESAQSNHFSPYQNPSGLQNRLSSDKVLTNNSNALLPLQASPEMGLSSPTVSVHSSLSHTSAGSVIAQQILEQIQGLKAEIIQTFLTAMTLLTDTFRTLTGSQETLTKSIQQYNEDPVMRTLNDLTAAFDMGYRQKMLALASRIKTAVEMLDGLQESCCNHARPVPAQLDRHTKSTVDLIDIALEEIPVGGNC